MTFNLQSHFISAIRHTWGMYCAGNSKVFWLSVGFGLWSCSEYHNITHSHVSEVISLSFYMRETIE